jgi:predicted lipoprotein with Yx(FWY)xxD motif
VSSTRQQLRAGRLRTAGLVLTVGALVLGYGGTAALAQSASPAAMGAVTTVNSTTTELGTFLTDADGRTLYFFTMDTAPGASVCEGGCLDNWPILAVAADGSLAAGEGVTGVLSAFTRADGTMQATYDGRPLYYFVGDAAAGDVLGQGLNDVWFVAAVDGSVPAPAAP